MAAFGLMFACNGKKQKNEVIPNEAIEETEITIIEEDIPVSSSINIKDSLKIDPAKGAVVENRYTGIFPGANSAIEYDLTLFFQQDSEEGVYALTMTYLDKGDEDNNYIKSYGKRQVVIGMKDDPKAIVYKLTPYTGEDAIYFAVTKNRDLILLDKDLKKIESENNYTLKLIKN